MKHTIRISLASAALLIFCGICSAQTFETSFFLDNYSYAHRINPAFQSDKNIVGVALSNISSNAASNLGISSILFPREGKLVLGLNKTVSSEEFLSRINPENNAVEDFSLNLLTIGIRSKDKKSFHTFEINARAYLSAMIPYDMFAFVKKGGIAQYDMTGTMTDLRGYMDFAYGYSRKIGDKIKIGARAKFLLGMAGAGVYSDKMLVNCSESNINVQAINYLKIAQPCCSMQIDKDGYYDWNTMKFSNFGISGYGVAADLGIFYEPIPGLETSIALTDIGGLWWNYNVCGKSDGNVNITNAANEDELKRFEDFTKFRPDASSKGFEMIPFNINAGIRYHMPFYDKLSVGVLGTYHNYKGTQYYNARLGATVSPIHWFSFTANYGYGTYGHSAGTMLSITGGCFNFFIGAETYLGKVMADAPLPTEKFRLALNGGITFRF